MVSPQEFHWTRKQNHGVVTSDHESFFDGLGWGGGDLCTFHTAGVGSQASLWHMYRACGTHTFPVQQHILWFQIPVNDALGVEMFYSQHDLRTVETATDTQTLFYSQHHLRTADTATATQTLFYSQHHLRTVETGTATQTLFYSKHHLRTADTGTGRP